jgi:N-acetylglucosaminyl-diphospho-decaprenol L-rhamnosyltransferase
MAAKPLVDVVVVSYNSREFLRDCVEPLVADPELRVVVVDNASPDQSLEAVEGLDVLRVARDWNAGFARACNEGWSHTSAPYVLFLNPDARIEPEDVRRLVAAVERDENVAIVGPSVVGFDGTLAHSQRRFLTVPSIWAQAFFLHHVFPRAAWTDGIIRNDELYAIPGSPDWVSGACLLARRSILQRLAGFDEAFFMYCEDQDLCRRARAAGFDVRYEPSAVAAHMGGASAPRAASFPVLVQSRRHYLAKHRGPVALAAGRVGLAVGESIRLVFTRGGLRDRAGHLDGLRAALGRATLKGRGH